MKHKFLLKTMLLLCALIVGSGSAWAEEVTFTPGTDTGATSVTKSGVTATMTTMNNSSYYQIYANQSGTFSVTSGNITKIEFTCTASGTSKYGPGNASANVGSYSYSGNTGTWTGEASAITISSTAQIRMSSLTITYTPATPSYTINAQSNNTSYGTVSLSGSVITGSPNSGYRYATPAYTVSPANSATVAQNGNEFTVTPSANTTVTINFEAIPCYTVTLGDNSATLTEASAGAGVTLPTRSTLNGYEFAGWSATNVSNETTEAPTIIPAGTYYPTADMTLYPVYTKTIAGGGTTHETASVTVSEYATAHSWGSSSSSGQKSITLNSDVTATCNDGTNSGKYYSDWRIYQNETGKVTISTTSGELTSVTFTFTVSNTGTLNYNSSAITSGTAVDVSGTSAEFTVGNSGSATNGQVRITAISVNYDVTGGGTTYYWSAPVAAAVETPSISVADNPFLFSTTVTITCATDGATIKYSYDNSTWSDYSAALTITETTTIYAKAIKGNDESTVASVEVTKNLATPTVTVSGDLTLDLDGETNVSAGTLTAAVTYDNAAVDGATVTWSSSNTDIATIDDSGAVTIKTTGSVTFTATYAGNSDYAEATGTKTVTVVDSNAPGSTQQNPYTVAQAIANTPANGTSSNVYIRGIVSAFYNTSVVGDGTNYRYYVSDDGTTTTQLLVYKGKKNSTDAFSSADDLEIGDVVVIYGGLTTYNSTKEVASGNYIVSRTTKTASDLTKTNNISLGMANPSVTATATDYFTTSSTGDISYEIADEAVATVSAAGVVTPVAAGTTTLTVSQAADATYKAGSLEITVTVAAASLNSTTIAANASGSTTYGTNKVEDYMIDDTYDGTVAAVSSNPAVATVAITQHTAGEGTFTITPVAVGTAVITISAPATATCEAADDVTYTITVTAPVGGTTAKTGGQTLLFGESFGDNSGSARTWDDSYSVKSGVSDVYSGITGYTVVNAKQTKNTGGSTASGLNQSTSGTDASIIIGPLNVASYSDLTLTYQWKAASVKGTYSTSAYYATSSTGDYTELTGTGDGATTFVERAYDLPAAAQVSTLYLKIVWNTSNTNAIIDEIQLSCPGAGTESATLNASGYATFCSQYPLDFSDYATADYSAWQITGVSGETITFSQITGSVKGGTGILLKGTAGETITLTSDDSEITLSGNKLYGTLAPTYVAAEQYYGLSGNQFKKVNAGTVPAGKALLPASEISSGVKAFTFVFEEDDPTGINTVNGEGLMANDPIYNLAGQRISKMQKGINIVNGKKIMY